MTMLHFTGLVCSFLRVDPEIQCEPRPLGFGVDEHLEWELATLPAPNTEPPHDGNS